MVEDVLCIIKSGAMSRGHYEDIYRMISDTGVFVIAARVMASPCKPGTPEYKMFEELFSPLANTPIYQRVLDSATNPIAGAIILFRGENAIQKVNQIAGDVDPARAAPGTIRKLFGIDRIDNALHVSSDKEMTDRQVGILFPDLRCEPLPAMETGD